MSREQAPRPGYGRILDAWVPPEHTGDPVGCVATSFTFSAAFFEEECLGRFLQMETNAAEDGPAYLVEREEKLAQLVCAAVLVDQHHARGVRSLRWDLLPARVPNGILHAKVSLLLWSRHARLIIASANLTEDGYRRNHEVFGVLDYFEGGDTPLAVLDDFVSFLRDAATWELSPGHVSPAAARWNRFLERVSTTTATWGTREPQRGFAKPRVFGIFTGPNRPNALDAIRSNWPDSAPPAAAYVVSPFFDPPDAPNEPARLIWNVLRQRGEASVEYSVTAEEIPNEKAVFIHAPQTLAYEPPNRAHVKTMFRRLSLESGRPLHAKCLWFENDRLILYSIGSSNFTSAGLGIGSTKNIEANLAYAVGRQSGAARRALENAWLPSDDLPADVKWKPCPDNGEDSAGTGTVLPEAFAEARFGRDSEHNPCIELFFKGRPPVGWQLFVEAEAAAFLTELEWETRGRPAALRLSWNRSRAPSGFRVGWKDSIGFAWWPVNVTDGRALPTPDVLKDLPLEVLIDLLTSARPLHRALGRWFKRESNKQAAVNGEMIDPHKRVDTSTFLLQRTRRVSWALTALRQRLERPVLSEESLQWRLRGPVGVQALVQAISREARSEAERCFLLTELCLELNRVSPAESPGSLSKARIRSELRGMIQEIRAGISSNALAENPALARYAESAFEKVLL